MCVWTLHVTLESLTKIYNKPRQSIICSITTLAYQMTTCGPSAVQPMCAVWVLLSFYKEHLVGIGTAPTSHWKTKAQSLSRNMREPNKHITVRMQENNKKGEMCKAKDFFGTTLHNPSECMWPCFNRHKQHCLRSCRHSSTIPKTAATS